MKLTANVLHGFVETCLLSRFDSPEPIPAFHHTLWELCCSDDKYVAIAAPRGHAKSTAVSLSYLLGCVLFREHDFVVLISDTETQAIQFLNDIKVELVENENIRTLFDVKEFVKDNEKDLICTIGPDNYQFRIIVKSSGTPLRGLKWRNKRPNLIIGDDLENDEIVMNQERREKFRNWVFAAVLPCLSDYGKIRIVGTILHFDSFLYRLMPQVSGEGSEHTRRVGLMYTSTIKPAGWRSVLFRAHTEMDDFSEILWPEKFSKERLQYIRSLYTSQGYPEGYSQEYLNYPLDNSTAFFRRLDLVPMTDEDYKKPKVYYASADLAISLKQKADYSVFLVGGVDEDGVLHIVNVVRQRMDSREIMDTMFQLQSIYKPDVFLIESGHIEKSIMPLLVAEMGTKGRDFINVWPVQAIIDKRSRARPIQGRIRMGGVRFDTKASWWSTFEEELLRFDKAPHDDQVDALAHLGLFLNNMVKAPTTEDLIEEAYYEELERSGDVGSILPIDGKSGRSKICGY